MPGNPYARDLHAVRQVPGPSELWTGNGRYAVPQPPDSTDPEYTIAFSPALKSGGSSTGDSLPDDIRIGKRNPPVENWFDEKWQTYQGRDYLKRHDEDVLKGQWHVRQRPVPPPNVPIWRQDRPPTRPTASQSPTGYLFTSPRHIPRNAVDAIGPDAVLHFSLASNRRAYKIMGQQPRGRVGVNTYRADPKPWDEQLFYRPVVGQQSLSSITGNSSYRAG